jgi:hypothetical protein
VYYQYSGDGGPARLRNTMQGVCNLVNAVNAEKPAATTTYKAKLPAAHLSPRCLTQAECNRILAEAQELALPDGDDFADGVQQRSTTLDSRNPAHRQILQTLRDNKYYDHVYSVASAGLRKRSNLPEDLYVLTFLNHLPPDTRTGMHSHADEPCYCAIVGSLTGDGGHPGLYFTPDSSTLVNLPLDQGDFAYVHRECVHGVHFHQRTTDRWTLNTFVYPEDAPCGTIPRIRLDNPAPQKARPLRRREKK